MCLWLDSGGFQFHVRVSVPLSVGRCAGLCVYKGLCRVSVRLVLGCVAVQVGVSTAVGAVLLEVGVRGLLVPAPAHVTLAVMAAQAVSKCMRGVSTVVQRRG